MIKSALEPGGVQISCINSANFESFDFMLQIYKSHFITFSCYHDHLQGHQVVISDTANEFSTKLQREWSDQIALKMCTKRFPKIGIYGQYKIQRCIVNVNKKQTIPKIQNYWITSTMEWHWKTNLESWTKILCINSANYECLVLCYKSHFITFSCYHDHLQGSQIVINDAANEFSTMLRRG